MGKIWLPVTCSLFTIKLFSTSAFAQENNNTNSTLTPTVSTTTPIATGKIFSIAPSVSLTSTKTTEEATSPGILTLSIIGMLVAMFLVKKS